MSDTVVYLMSHNPHTPYLVASLYTLRRHYDGEVQVHAWKESFEIVDAISKDKRLNFQAVLREPTYRGKNDQFLDKIHLVRRMDRDRVLYLDADTTIHGSIQPLFDFTLNKRMLVTQFNDWTTIGRTIRNRLERLRGRDGIDQIKVNKLLNNEYASVNGGVFAADPKSEALYEWENQTRKVLDIFIADETVLHTIALRSDVYVLSGGRFNCSPKYQPKDMADSHVAIRHYHGDSNVRPKKSQKGYDLWWPILQRCYDENVGSIQSWIGSINNKHLNPLLERLYHG